VKITRRGLGVIARCGVRVAQRWTSSQFPVYKRSLEAAQPPPLNSTGGP
jgi:hypothetical protein